MVFLVPRHSKFFLKEDALIPSDSAIDSPPTPSVGCLHAYFCYINAWEVMWVTGNSTHTSAETHMSNIILSHR